MKIGKALKFLGLLLLWRPTESNPQRMLFLGGLGLSKIVGLVKPLVLPLIGGLPRILKGPPQSPDFGLLVQGIEESNVLLEDIRDNLENFAEDFKYVLIELGHEERILEVSGLSTKMKNILASYQDGTYDFEEYEEKFNALAEEVDKKLYDRMISINAAKSYLERLRKKMIQEKVDLVTYSVKLSLAIQDFLEHYQTAIKLLRCCSVHIGHLDKLADDLGANIPDLTQYKTKFVHGKYLPLVQYLLEEERDESEMSGKVLKPYKAMKHLVSSPEGLPGDVLGLEAAFETPLFITPTPEAVVGNFTINIGFEVNGVRKPLGASNANKAAKFDFDLTGSERWKLVPCESYSLENAVRLDYVCIVNVHQDLYLTEQNVEGSDRNSTYLREFSPSNPNQLWMYEDKKRCCDLFEEANFQGTHFGVCLDLKDDFKNFDQLPDSIKSVMSIKCSGARIYLYSGESHSGQEVIISEGALVASLDPAQITTIKSFVVDTRCSRIFTNPDMTGDFRSICKDTPNLEGKFLNKNISILIADRAIQLFKEPGYQGESIVIRQTMSLEDLPWQPESVKLL